MSESVSGGGYFWPVTAQDSLFLTGLCELMVSVEDTLTPGTAREECTAGFPGSLVTERLFTVGLHQEETSRK